MPDNPLKEAAQQNRDERIKGRTPEDQSSTVLESPDDDENKPDSSKRHVSSPASDYRYGEAQRPWRKF